MLPKSSPHHPFHQRPKPCIAVAPLIRGFMTINRRWMTHSLKSDWNLLFGVMRLAMKCAQDNLVLTTPHTSQRKWCFTAASLKRCCRTQRGQSVRGWQRTGADKGPGQTVPHPPRAAHLGSPEQGGSGGHTLWPLNSCLFSSSALQAFVNSPCQRLAKPDLYSDLLRQRFTPWGWQPSQHIRLQRTSLCATSQSAAPPFPCHGLPHHNRSPFCSKGIFISHDSVTTQDKHGLSQSSGWNWCVFCSWITALPFSSLLPIMLAASPSSVPWHRHQYLLYRF